VSEPRPRRRRAGPPVDPKQSNRRIRLLLAVFLVVFAAALARAFWLQGVRAHALGAMAASQHHETVTVAASRGTIYDRTGVELALGEEARTVYANPRQIRNPRAVALAVGRALGLDPNELIGPLSDRTKGFVYVARQADPARVARLEKLDLPGLGFSPEERRVYPQHAVAAQVLGYAGLDERGLAGLELGLDRQLTGRPGSETVVKDALGRPIDVVSSRPERPGRDVFLTLDHSIQANAEAVLRETISQWHAKAATAIVLDPRTGEVLAMADEPGFDANRYPSTPPARQRNRAVTDTYEPGSTFKIVTAAGALSEHLVTENTTFTLPYGIQVADRVIHDAEPRPTETMSVRDIVARSSNVGAITLARLLGEQRLMAWIRRFGFGRRTGIDFPGESPGIVLPLAQWSGSTIGNVPIGQGISVTPLQMAEAYAAVANGGVAVTPHLVARVGTTRTRPGRRRMVSPRVAAELRDMLRDVVAEGTGTLAAVPGYKVAGKTGTASKPDPHGGYSTTRYVASFVGLVPASAPRLVILVAVDEPHGQIWGGTVAAPAFAQIARFDLQYLEVPPDDPASAETAAAATAPTQVIASTTPPATTDASTATTAATTTYAPPVAPPATSTADTTTASP
jgi:cell division protein FtsI (penicillin-binding protein 3)/stage V sporulation protein D (sporulation-specific penicillin-binding protein)